jgi:hypothetical protein
MALRKFALNMTLVTATMLALIFFGKNLPAAFSPEELFTSIEIDGVDYGRFAEIEGLEQAVADDSEQEYQTVTLTRDFVTDPSLYLWAKNAVANRIGVRDVHLVRRDDKGREVSRTVLRLCQPLSWTVEAAGPGVGGFHESVELAVREVTNPI